MISLTCTLCPRHVLPEINFSVCVAICVRPTFDCLELLMCSLAFCKFSAGPGGGESGCMISVVIWTQQLNCFHSGCIKIHPLNNIDPILLMFQHPLHWPESPEGLLHLSYLNCCVNSFLLVRGQQLVTN